MWVLLDGGFFSCSGMIEIEGIGKTFTTASHSLTVLQDINLSIGRGEFIAVTGPSGSGKSTLLGIMAGLDRPSTGRVILDGVEITGLAEKELALLRGRKLGFVFQSFQLIPTLTALENVRVPAELCRLPDLAARAPALLARVGLADRSDHYPSQLSGGEMQRVAIARALVTEPAIIFADEPTGNLDSKNGDVIIGLLKEANQHSALVLVTHNPALARLAGREIQLRDGRIERIIIHKKSHSQTRAGKKTSGHKKNSSKGNKGEQSAAKTRKSARRMS
jgi:putative ABC transport system ATP-binding protein